MEVLKKKKSLIINVIIFSIVMHLCITLIFFFTQKHQPKPLSKITPKKKKETLFMQPKVKSKPDPKKAADLTVGHKLMPKSNAPAVMQKILNNKVDNITPSLQKMVPSSTEKKIKPVEKKDKTKKKKIIKKEHSAPKKKLIKAQAKAMPQDPTDQPKKDTLIKEKKKKPVFSLKDLQKGFTKYLRHGNNDVMSRKGDKNANITPRDLKLMSYHRQIANTFESAASYVGSININNLSKDKNVRFILTIERDGTISNVTYTQLSKHDLINNHTRNIIKNLGSFPPLPSYIEAPYIFQYGVLYYYDKIRYY